MSSQLPLEEKKREFFLRKWESHRGFGAFSFRKFGRKAVGAGRQVQQRQNVPSELRYVLLHGGKELHKQERRVLEFGYNFQLRFQFLLSEHGS